VDSNGNPVNNANITINNSAIDPPIIDASYSTYDTNILRLPVIPSDSYEITVSKSAYSTDRTYSSSELSPSTPVKLNLEVGMGETTEASFVIDEISKFNIRTVRATLPENRIVNFSSFDGQNPSVDSDGTYSYFVWDNSVTSIIYLQKLDLGGNSQFVGGEDLSIESSGFSPDIKVIKDLNLSMCFTKKMIDHNNIYVSFLDSSGGILSSGFADSQITNQANCRLSYSHSASTTIVVWDDERDFASNSNDVYIKIYNDDFTTRSINRVNANTPFNQYDPDSVVDSDGNIYVVWTDERNGDEDIYMQKLDSNGNRIWTSDKIINIETNNGQNSPAIAVDSNNYIYVVWTDNRSGDDGIYMQKLDSSGNNIWSADKRVNVETYANQHSPKITIDDSDNIYVVWVDNRNVNNNSNDDIYLQKLNTDGSKFSRDYRVNINNDASSQNMVDISINNNYPIVVWSDNRNDKHDIYFSKFLEYSNPATATYIDVGLQGTKKTGTAPDVFKYNFDNSTINTGASGYISNYDVDADGSGYIIDAANVLMIDPSSPVKIAPGETRDIMIYLQ
jgi:hypothetical protein